ncbi:MAG: hypothetical protein HY696_01805 [Deltaproteobacteria bacterium]|nr:hypothetical protein [Deltaproteobacteria bacterium]
MLRAIGSSRQCWESHRADAAAEARFLALRRSARQATALREAIVLGSRGLARALRENALLEPHTVLSAVHAATTQYTARAPTHLWGFNALLGAALRERNQRLAALLFPKLVPLFESFAGEIDTAMTAYDAGSALAAGMEPLTNWADE